MVYGVGSCDEDCSSIHEPAGKMEARMSVCEMAIFYFLFHLFIYLLVEELDHIFLAWFRFRAENGSAKKKLPPIPPELPFQRTCILFSFSECFIKRDERKRSVLRWDALCSERDLSKRSHAGAPRVCPTGLLCAACWSFFLLSCKQLSNC